MSGRIVISDLQTPSNAANVDAHGYLKVTETATSIFAGRATVATPGVPVQLSATPTAVQSVAVKALSANSGIVYVWTANSDGRAAGFELNAKEAVSVVINDLSKVWIDAATAGQGVCYLGS